MYGIIVCLLPETLCNCASTTSVWVTTAVKAITCKVKHVKQSGQKELPRGCAMSDK
jgi:hypothetical protein